ncbi:hypothetical protein C8R42DRAFT_64503 [Lentinula raphanica]|nr:hypothetical protein C8R42DRAFT_64503 [Lentinula raphanica]
MNPMQRDMLDIIVGYAFLAQPRSIELPSGISFAEINRCLVEHIVLNPHFQLYPPSKQYQRAFWKTMIGRLEELLARQEAEVRCNDEMMEFVWSSNAIHTTRTRR